MTTHDTAETLLLDAQHQALDPATLDDVARRTEHLAMEKRRQQRNEEQAETDVGDRPKGVPWKASLTVKTISDNRYAYWQWRDGDSVKSKYHSPTDEE